MYMLHSVIDNITIYAEAKLLPQHGTKIIGRVKTNISRIFRVGGDKAELDDLTTRLEQAYKLFNVGDIAVPWMQVLTPETWLVES